MNHFLQLGNLPATLFLNTHIQTCLPCMFPPLYLVLYGFPIFFLSKHFVIFQVLSLPGSLPRDFQCLSFLIPFLFWMLDITIGKDYSSVFDTDVEISPRLCLKNSSDYKFTTSETNPFYCCLENYLFMLKMNLLPCNFYCSSDCVMWASLSEVITRLGIRRPATCQNYVTLTSESLSFSSRIWVINKPHRTVIWI